MDDPKPGAALPAYARIQEALRQQIECLRPGDPLPSETALAREFGVSRMTARQAINRLAGEGRIVRRVGVGNFVAEPRVHRRMGGLLSFSAEMLRKGRMPASHMLDVRTIRAPADMASRLDIAPGAPVLRVRRLRLADGVPMAVETAHMPVERFPDLPAADLEFRSLHETFQERYGVIPTYARGSLTSESATAREARWLDLPTGAPLLVERRTIFDQHNQPVEWTETRYAGERYVFDLELHRQPE